MAKKRNRTLHQMENFFPNNGTVDLRKGEAAYAASPAGGDAMDTLRTHVSNSGVETLVTRGSGALKMYSVDVGGGGMTNITGAVTFTQDFIYSVNFRGSIFMKEDNSSKDVFAWNGAGNLTQPAFTGPAGDDKALSHITSYKNRIYFSDYKGTSIWYGGVDAVTGTLTEFPLASIFRLGGKISFIGSVSLSGIAVQEVFVIISNIGEVVIYQGDYPGANTWGLLGRYTIPRPAGERAFFYWGQDLLIITQQGLVSLVSVLNTGIDQEVAYFTDTIFSAFKTEVDALLLSSANTAIGIVYPGGPYLVINTYPATTGHLSDGYATFVMNLITRSWCRFISTNLVYDWALLKGRLYFSSFYGVGLADEGDEDFRPDGNQTNVYIRCSLVPAYNYLGNRSSVKQFVEARPILYQSEGLNITMDADVDYGNVEPTSKTTDTTDTSYKLYRPRIGLKGIGKCASIRFDKKYPDVFTKKKMSLQAIDVIWNEGDIV